MKLYIKWSDLTPEQKSQVKTFHQKDPENFLHEHVLNRMKFLINPTNGSFVSRKDF